MPKTTLEYLIEDANKKMKQYTSAENSFLINDYPYGGLRCKRRCWIEDGGVKKGFRFCTQTTNPKRIDEVWNKPKKGTYVYLAMCMYLDADGHVDYDCLSEYSGVKDVLTFLNRHAENAHYSIDMMRVLSGKKLLCEYVADKKKSVFTVNGEQTKASESDIADARNEALQWGKAIEVYQAIQAGE